MLVIRLFRVGKKNQPIFKIVVTEKSRSSRAGRFVEEVGSYNPLTKEKILKSERIKYWIGVGAIASDTVHNFLISEKIIEGAKRKIAIKKSKKEKPEEPKETAKPAEKPAPVKEPEPKEQETKPPEESSLKEEAEPAEEPESEKAKEKLTEEK